MPPIHHLALSCVATFVLCWIVGYATARLLGQTGFPTILEITPFHYVLNRLGVICSHAALGFAVITVLIFIGVGAYVAYLNFQK